MAAKIDFKTHLEVLRVLRQHCSNDDEYSSFSWAFSYTRQLGQLKENPVQNTPQRRHHINKKIKYFLNKLNQLEKTNDQL